MIKDYCMVCGQQIIRIPFVGTKFHTFQDGIACEKCAQILVQMKRKGKFIKKKVLPKKKDGTSAMNDIFGSMADLGGGL